MDFLLVIIELFSLGVTAETLNERMSIRSRLFRGGESIWPKISDTTGRPPPTVCALLDRPVVS